MLNYQRVHAITEFWSLKDLAVRFPSVPRFAPLRVDSGHRPLVFASTEREAEALVRHIACARRFRKSHPQHCKGCDLCRNFNKFLGSLICQIFNPLKLLKILKLPWVGTECSQRQLDPWPRFAQPGAHSGKPDSLILLCHLRCHSVATCCYCCSCCVELCPLVSVVLHCYRCCELHFSALLIASWFVTSGAQNMPPIEGQRIQLLFGSVWICLASCCGSNMSGTESDQELLVFTVAADSAGLNLQSLGDALVLRALTWRWAYRNPCCITWYHSMHTNQIHRYNIDIINKYIYIHLS